MKIEQNSEDRESYVDIDSYFDSLDLNFSNSNPVSTASRSLLYDRNHPVDDYRDDDHDYGMEDDANYDSDDDQEYDIEDDSDYGNEYDSEYDDDDDPDAEAVAFVLPQPPVGSRKTRLDQVALKQASQEIHGLFEQLQRDPARFNPAIARRQQRHPKRARKVNPFLKGVAVWGIFLGAVAGSASLYRSYCSSGPLCSGAPMAAQMPEQGQMDYVNTVHQSTSANPEFNPFREAVNIAMRSAEEVQVARTAADWKAVSEGWMGAILLMNVVPESSIHYELAQQKIKEYVKNLAYAQQQAKLLAQREQFAQSE